MRTNLISLLFVSAALTVAADADAKPRRVVVAEFDGPQQLATVGRATVLNVLGEQYNIVATKNWDTARARAQGRGPQQWRQASKQAGVDAVIEGWVQTEGRHHVLTLAIKDAANGQEIDTVSIRLKDKGVSTDVTHKLAAELDEVLSWIDGDVNAEPSQSLPDVRTLRPMLGARDPDRDRKEEAAGDDRDDRASDDDDERPTKRKKRKHHRIEETSSDDDSDEVSDSRRKADRDDRDDRDDRRSDRRDDRASSDEGSDEEATPEKRKREAKRTVAALDVDTKDTNGLVQMFGPESKEADIATDGKLSHVPRPTPKYFISAGPYLGARGMAFDYDVPDASSPTPPNYPASVVKGLGAHVAVFPLPLQKQDGRASGLGFTLDVQKSVASTLTVQNNNNGDYVECELDQTAWQLGIHYRWPMDFVTVGVDGNFGASGTKIVDVPEDLGFADTAYSYLGGGAHIELAVTERSTVGFNARYMYLLSAGNITDEAAYGAGKAYGLALGGEFKIPLPSSLFLRGAVDYTRYKIDFEGSGELTKQMNVFSVTDGAITGSADVGISF